MATDTHGRAYFWGTREVDETEARFALLQTELNALEGGIRGLDSIIFQINGWCVTVTLAVGGVALASGQSRLALLGVGAVLGFFLINCQFKTFQRAMIDRKEHIKDDLTTTGLAEWLRSKDKNKIVGPINPILAKKLSGTSSGGALWREARSVHTFGLYLFTAVGLIIVSIIIYTNSLSFG
jgi:hypothetical protein